MSRQNSREISGINVTIDNHEIGIDRVANTTLPFNDVKVMLLKGEKGDGADITAFAPVFSDTTAYSVGAFVTYNEKFYKCTTAHSAGAWNASHFTQTSVDESFMAKGRDYVTAGRGVGTTAGTKSTAEGQGNTASGNYSHAEGNNNVASGHSSHVEGQSNSASKAQAHAEGSSNAASGPQSHVEGSSNTASGTMSHCEGYDNVASHSYSHVSGSHNNSGAESQFVCGKYNKGKTSTVLEVGYGTGSSASERRNVFEVFSNGDIAAYRNVTDGYGNTLSAKINKNTGLELTTKVTYNPDTRMLAYYGTTLAEYDEGAYSKSGYKDNVYLSFKPNQTDATCLVGLHKSKNLGTIFSMSYCFALGTAGSLSIKEEGVSITPPSDHRTYAVGDELRIEYSGGYVRYYHNGVCIRSVSRLIGNPLYFNFSVYNEGSAMSAALYDVTYGTGIANETSGYVHTSDITYDPDTKTISCSKGNANAWNSQLYSKSGYKDNVFVTYKPSSANRYAIVGLTSTPSSSAGYDYINYGFYTIGTGNLQICENGTFYTLPAGHTTYSADDELRIEYSGGYVRYYHNGVLVRSVARAIGNPLYLDSAFYNSGSVYDVEFGAGLGSANIIEQPALTDAFTVSSIATLGTTGFVQKQGNIVSMYINLNSTSSGTYGDIGVLASKYRPKTQLYTVAYDYQAKKAVGAWIDSSSGTVRIYEYVSGHEYTISATYFSAT